jgi:hypothetical protein
MESRAGEPLKEANRYMRIRKRYAAILALAAAGAVAVSGIAMAASSSTFSFKFSPSTAPKQSYKAGALFTDLRTTYTNPADPVDRTQIYLDKNFKINTNAAGKCSSSQLSNKTMKQAMAACKNALVGTGKAQAQGPAAIGTIRACVLLFNGQPQNGKPTLKVFTRAQATPNSQINCSNPANNNQGNATVLLNGVLKGATGKYGKVLDVAKISQASPFPLTVYTTTIKKGNYFSARCAAADKTWHMQIIWTYKSGQKNTVHKTQKCTVG